MNIVPFENIAVRDEPRAGAKAFNCARLKRAGFPVPDGLIVLTTVTEAELATLPNHFWFDWQPADTLFAVRSSGIGEDGERQSFAGIHETRLNVTRSDVGEAVAACRASASSPQAIAYRRARGTAIDDIRIAILIQRMVTPVAAGVAFTVNPVTGAEDQMVINSSWGLGEALVSGQVDPDEFGVAKRDGSILWSQLGEKEGSAATTLAVSLTPSQVVELSSIARAIEAHYGWPQDIEWCHDGTQFWIVQSRPVTTAPRGTDSDKDGLWGEPDFSPFAPSCFSQCQMMPGVDEHRSWRDISGRWWMDV